MALILTKLRIIYAFRKRDRETPYGKGHTVT